jgi:uncharacterized protein
MFTISCTIKAATVAAALAFSASAWAQTPSVESVERLLNAVNGEKMVKEMYSALRPMMSQMAQQGAAASGKPLSPQQAAATQRIMQRMIGVIETEFTWETMKPMMVRSYREVYTQPEIDGLIGFFESPIGQAYTVKAPQLAAASMRDTQNLLGNLMPKIKQIIEAEAAELKKSQ